VVKTLLILGLMQRPDEIAERLDIRTLQRAVAPNVSEDEVGDVRGLQLYRHRAGVDLGLLEPAAGCEFAIAGIEADGDAIAPALNGSLNEVRRLEGSGAENATINPRLKDTLQVRFAAEAAAKLETRAPGDALLDAKHLVVVDGLTGHGTIEVHDV
jgi:hypothetical protein